MYAEMNDWSVVIYAERHQDIRRLRNLLILLQDSFITVGSVGLAGPAKQDSPDFKKEPPYLFIANINEWQYIEYLSWGNIDYRQFRLDHVYGGDRTVPYA